MQKRTVDGILVIQMVQHFNLDQREIGDEGLQKAQKDSNEHDPP